MTVGREERVDILDLLSSQARTDFLAEAQVRSLPAGSRIYTQDDHGRVMYRFVSGTAYLSFAREDGRELLFGLIGPGECLGISSLIDGEGLPHSAVARSDVQLQVVDEQTLSRLRAKHRSIDEAFLVTMCRDIRILSYHLSEAALDGLPSRVARRLLALAGDPAPGGRAPEVKMPQAELAALFGVSRQTLNKVLKRFEDDGLVRLSYGGVRLVDVPRLRESSLFL